MLVRATNKYEELKLKDKGLNRIPKAGEEFEVTEERYNLLNKNNKFNVVFVEKVEEIETATVKPKVETAIKKTRKVKNIEIDLDKGTVKENYDL